MCGVLESSSATTTLFRLPRHRHIINARRPALPSFHLPFFSLGYLSASKFLPISELVADGEYIVLAMFLKEVILDGFKSYATRTVVKDFDQSFNAITGLNGSGKSNVLDSICFVLGITNLSQVRASSLQELVYKGGQAGVTKATVTLVFNNTDKRTAPVGYEQPDEITITRQIVVGGRNRYLINGINAQPGRVQNLFHSVGLNVNNPHFLIMQGRITKVINMKPPEVLSMIEEAAGTKMYENKKEAALKTIEKKERKVGEINSLLEEKINPSLAKLEREQKHYLEWNENNNEIESLKRFLIAYKYWKAQDTLRRGEGSQLQSRVEANEISISKLQQYHKDAKAKLESLLRSRSVQLDGGKLQEKQSEVDDLGKKIVKLRSLCNNQKEALSSEEQTLHAVKNSIVKLKERRNNLVKQIVHADAQLQPAEDNLKCAKESLETAETALLTGASTQGANASGTGSLVDQLEAARREVSRSQTEIESLQLEAKHLSSLLQSKAAELKKDRANVRVLESQKKSAEKAISDAKLAVHELDFDSSSAESLNEKLQDERRHTAVFTERVDQLSARLASCDFRYSDPHPNFNRRRVHGLVAKLIRLKDPRMTTAIEVTAGGRLYQVVVDTDSTANELLKKGKLVRRVTILPLNKLRHDVVHRSKIDRAKAIEPSAELALSLVGYDEDVSNAMEYVFGRTLVCPDMDSAKRVTFDSHVRTRTVTVDGDVYDPSGTASGGSSSRQGPSVLALLGELKDAEADLYSHKGNKDRLEIQVSALNEKAKQFRQLQAALDMRQKESNLLEKRLGETSTGRLIKEVAELRERISHEIPKGMSAANEALSRESERVKELEVAMENSESTRARVQKEAETAIEKVRAAHSAATANLQVAKDQHSSLLVDKETVDEELEMQERQHDQTLLPSIEKLRKELLDLGGKVDEVRDRFQTCQLELDNERDRLASSKEAIAIAKNEAETLSENIETLSLERAKLESKLREADRGRVASEKLISDLDAKHTWIVQEKESFSVEGGEYEFSRDKVTTSGQKLEALAHRQEALVKKVNKKAMYMFETAKEEYRSLMKKKGIIEQDKEKIEKVIAGLDEKKMVAVEKTWRKVNEDFGNIFSDLLPGTNAKLEPTGQSVEDGLEIRVAFGDVWKDSLSELSGGQRSLIALSLILAMLRFKPAPMYILDEVDAALDLSHTQNIGRMLRRHFSESQFIVVSLKEGMFSNANVIFRTKFVDGVSTIKRTENDALRLAEKGGEAFGASNLGLDKENIENDAAVAKTRNPRKRRAVH